MAKRVYDFTQDASRVWLSSNKETKQRLLRAFSLNRTVTDVTLCLEKRKPFSFLTERLPVRTSRGDWQDFKREIQPYVMIFAQSPRGQLSHFQPVVGSLPAWR
jgi:hypothetical protein